MACVVSSAGFGNIKIKKLKTEERNEAKIIFSNDAGMAG